VCSLGVGSFEMGTLNFLGNQIRYLLEDTAMKAAKLLEKKLN
jgi:hypothetical protein